MTLEQDIKKYTKLTEQHMFLLRECDTDNFYKLHKSAYLAAEKVRIGLLRLQISLNRIKDK